MACLHSTAVLRGQVHEAASVSRDLSDECAFGCQAQNPGKNTLGVTSMFQPGSRHSCAQCREGGDKSLNQFVSDTDTNRTSCHVTDAAQEGLC